MLEAGIAERFSAGSLNYDNQATVQYRMAQAFAEWLASTPAGAAKPRPDAIATNRLGSHALDANTLGSNALDSDTVNSKISDLQTLHIVELGCGTGFLTQQMLARFPYATIDACDVSADMLTQCHIRNQATKQGSRPDAIRLHQADAAAFSTGRSSDWTVSSFCLQWISDLRGALQFHAQQTRRLSICVPCSASFTDWKDAHASVGLQAALWPLPRADKLTQWMQNIADTNNGHLRSKVMMVSEHHDSPLAFVRHFRAIGADYTGGKSTGAALKRVLGKLPSPYDAQYEVLMLDLVLR